MSKLLNTRVTVLMPVYNAAPYLKEAIESILTQTYKDFEFIIINDGSTDNSLQIIQSFNDARIRIISNESNLGIIKTRNKGLLLASGEYIANMDADDISAPSRLQKQVDYLDAHKDVAILAARLVLIDENNRELGVWPEDYYTLTKEAILKTLPLINCIGQPAIMMRKQVVNQILYNPAFKNNEDWGLWLHVLSLGYSIEKLPDVLLRYRQHPNSTTVSTNLLGVEKKIIAFKFQYLKFKLFKDKFRSTDKKVLGSFFKDLLGFTLKKITPRTYGFLDRLKDVNKLRYIRQFLNARKLIEGFKGKTNHLYFFPFFHTGGAERVHASILEAAAQKNAVTFITGRSDNKAFLDQFSKHSTVIEIDELIKIGLSKNWIQKQILTLLPGSDESTFFACNSKFFYQLIPYLPEPIKVIDLLHAFVHDYEDGPEKWSLPYVSRINARIVINEKTKSDFERLYAQQNVPEIYLSRISTIQNFVEAQTELITKDAHKLKVAYVGRAGEEKRVDLIARLAKNISTKNKHIEFHFVGKIKDAIPEELRPYCIFHNEISDEEQIQKLYAQFHVIIIASTREGFPMVIMEGMMQGAVPVSTNVGGIPEHVINNVNGILVTSHLEEELIKEFEEKITYLADNREELKRLSENAHDYALKNFNKELFFKKYFELLNPDKK